MAFSKLRSALLIILIPILSFGQTKDSPPPNWFNLDYERDGVMGISTERAYEQLLKGKKSTTVVVAVIDGGVDVNHEDLKDVIWVNEKDSAATGTDDDGNGYINDKHGWNFIGNANGENVHYDNLEVTRLIRDLEPEYISVLPSTPMSGEERREFAEYQKMVTYYADKTQEAHFGQASYTGLKRMVDTMVARIVKETPTLDDFDKYKPEGDLEECVDTVINQDIYDLFKYFDARHIVGGYYQIRRDRYDGNADVSGLDADYSTHVAGIIGAVRNNYIAIKGVSDDVRVVFPRTV